MTGWALRLPLLLAALTGAAVMEAAPEKMITILRTNDIHGHVGAWRGWEGELAGKTIGGMDRLATAIQQVRAEGTANDGRDGFRDFFLQFRFEREVCARMGPERCPSARNSRAGDRERLDG